MTSFVLNHAQIRKAGEVILDLMRRKRFFLSDPHQLDRVDFSDCLDLDRAVRTIYKQEQDKATREIEIAESSLGITPPSLKEGQIVVRCSFYTGGLEIQAVHPLEKYLRHAPKNRFALYTEIFAALFGPENEIAPKYMSEKREKATSLSGRIWREIEGLRTLANGIVLIQKTRFNPDSQMALRATRETTSDLLHNPTGLAYLFYKEELVEPLMKNGFALFDFGQDGHSRVVHFPREGVHLQFGNTGGYDCTVKFVCAM